METLAAAFTDHLAVCLRLYVVEPIMRRGPGYWKMDDRILEDKRFVEQFKILWDQLRKQKNVFPNTPIWCERSCKRMIQGFFHKVQAERMRDHRAMENYYYECIYESLQQPAHNVDTRSVLQKLKAKIVRLHNIRLNQLPIDNNTAERIEGEQPTMYNILKMRRKRNEPTITALRDQDGITQTTPRGIARTLVTYMCEKYKRREVNTEYVQHSLKEIETDKINQYNEAPAARFTQGEIEQAIKAGGRKRRQGEMFFRANSINKYGKSHYEMVEIFNQIFWDGLITPRQNKL
jgi:hypothetical protein